MSDRKRIISNICWMCTDSVVKSAIGMVISVWLARYLGPDKFGLLNYVIAIAFLFSAVATFGMNSIVVRDVIRSPGHHESILGTAVVVQIMGGLFAWLCAIATAFLLQPNNVYFVFLVALLGMVSVFKATEVIKFWFESQVQSRYSVWAENGVFLIFAVIKVWLLLIHAPFIAFVWILWAEALIAAVALMVVYTRFEGKLSQWQFQKKRLWQLIREGSPLMVSGLAMAGYMRMDQIMLGKLLNQEAVGVFSAALRLSEAWYFIPVSIMASLFPTVLSAKNIGKHHYISRLEFTHTIVVLIAFVLAIPITFCSDWVVTLLYGKAYGGAGAVLSLHIWSALFVFIGVASHQWFVAENLQRFVLLRTICGAVTNIVLNLILIPHYGPVGAACASLISHGLVNVVLNVCAAETRPVFWIQIKSLLLIPLWNGTIFRHMGRVS